MTRLLIITLIVLQACSFGVDNAGSEPKNVAFDSAIAVKYPQFNLRKAVLKFRAREKSGVCSFVIKKPLSDSEVNEVTALANDIYTHYHKEFEFSELFVQAPHVEFRFGTLPVPNGPLKVSTIVRRAQDTLIYIR